MDVNGKPNIDDYHNQFYDLMVKPTVFSIDARVKNDVSKLVQALFIA